MTLATYYDILNVSPRASDDEVRRAYKIQALRWHPDRNPANREAAERVFRQIARAYLHLKTQAQRDAYNRALLKLMQTRYETSGVLGRRRDWPPRRSKAQRQKYFRFGRVRRAPVSNAGVNNGANNNARNAPAHKMKETVNGR